MEGLRGAPTLCGGDWAHQDVHEVGRQFDTMHWLHSLGYNICDYSSISVHDNSMYHREAHSNPNIVFDNHIILCFTDTFTRLSDFA